MLTTEEKEGYVADVSHPGKLEGEAPFVAYLWNDSLYGCAEDVDDPNGDVFTVYTLDAELRAEWPEEFEDYTDGTEFWLHESDSGFVFCTTFTKESALAIRAEIDAAWEVSEVSDC